MFRTRRACFLLLAASVLALAGAPARAAPPCAGFGDVDALSGFCPNIEWIKNRGVTLGCATGLYCPTGTVTRDQMAAFMNRLGLALTPQQLVVDTVTGAVDLDLNSVVCQSADFAVSNYARYALLDLAFAGQAPGNVDLAADIVMTIDGGANWFNLTALPNRGSIPAGSWGNVANLATANLSVSTTARFGVRLSRVSGTANLSDGRCNLRVTIGSSG